jgi:hypothetical protein
VTFISTVGSRCDPATYAEHFAKSPGTFTAVTWSHAEPDPVSAASRIISKLQADGVVGEYPKWVSLSRNLAVVIGEGTEGHARAIDPTMTHELDKDTGSTMLAHSAAWNSSDDTHEYFAAAGEAISRVAPFANWLAWQNELDDHVFATPPYSAAAVDLAADLNSTGLAAAFIRQQRPFRCVTVFELSKTSGTAQLHQLDSIGGAVIKTVTRWYQLNFDPPQRAWNQLDPDHPPRALLQQSDFVPVDLRRGRGAVFSRGANPQTLIERALTALGGRSGLQVDMHMGIAHFKQEGLSSGPAALVMRHLRAGFGEAISRVGLDD